MTWYLEVRIPSVLAGFRKTMNVPPTDVNESITKSYLFDEFMVGSFLRYTTVNSCLDEFESNSTHLIVRSSDPGYGRGRPVARDEPLHACFLSSIYERLLHRKVFPINR